MLPLNKFHAGFFTADPAKYTLGEVPVGELKTWEQGKQLVGFSRGAHRPLTDGTADATFVGCEWIDEWDNREGYRLILTEELGNVLFNKATVELVFVGEIAFMGYYITGAPKHVAFREADVPAGLTRPLPIASLHCEHKLLCQAVSQGISGIEFSLWANPRQGSSNTYGMFRPVRALTRAEWRMLGYHIITRDAATVDKVTPIKTGNNVFAFSTDCVEDLAAAGITAEIDYALVGATTTLVPKTFTISDPKQAARYGSFLTHYPEGATLSKMESILYANDMVLLGVADLPVLKTVPAKSHLYRDFRSGDMAVFPQAEVAVTDQRPIRALRSNPWSNREFLILATKASVESHLLVARRAAAQYRIPEELKPLHVLIDGKQIKDNYYFLSDLAGLPAAGNKRKENQERMERLVATHGDHLPEGWKKMSDDQIEAYIKISTAYEKAAKDGWIAIDQFGAAIGLDSEGMRERMGVLRSWLLKSKWPAADHPKESGKSLYAPVVFEELVQHEDFGALFRDIAAGSYGFFSKAMFSEPARATVMVAAISS